jgi:bis(5'-nucleosyl)-tetraphosphatase (symmetrical)
MSIYAVGDIQGCYDDLLRLLDKIGFDADRDRLWCTGDLVNRGPKSLETLRFIKQLGEGAVTVLGNHDLHLLAVALTGRVKRRPTDTLDAVLRAPDRDELLDWLRRRPLLYYDPELDYVLVHAGLAPQWDLDTARALAAEVEAALRGPAHREFLADMYGDSPARWSETLTGIERLRFAVNCLTRMRYCDASGKLDFSAKGAPGSQPQKLLPWFEVPRRANAGIRILFGHWSTLGPFNAHNVYALDGGCLWGGQLVARRLDGGGRWICVNCAAKQQPG